MTTRNDAQAQAQSAQVSPSEKLARVFQKNSPQTIKGDFVVRIEASAFALPMQNIGCTPLFVCVFEDCQVVLTALINGNVYSGLVGTVRYTRETGAFCEITDFGKAIQNPSVELQKILNSRVSGFTLAKGVLTNKKKDKALVELSSALLDLMNAV